MKTRNASMKLWKELKTQPNRKLLKRCKLCRSDNIRIIDIYRAERLCLSRCLNCSFVFLNPQKKVNTYNPGHTKNVYVPKMIEKGLLDADGVPDLASIHARYSNLVKLIEHVYAPGHAVADLGCGIGLSMLAMKHKGIPSKGLEVDREFIEQAKLFGLDVDYRDIFEGSSEKYDIVSLSSVIEHIERPRKFLKAARKNLIKPGGHLVITAPNIYSVDFVTDGGDIPNINGGHLWYFSDNTLAKLLESAGYSVVLINKNNRRSFRDETMEHTRTLIEDLMGLDVNLSGGVGIVAKA